MSTPRLGDRVSGGLRHAWEVAQSRIAAPDSRVYVVGDGSGWVLDHEARELCRLVRRLGWHASVPATGTVRGIGRQRVFYFSQFVLPALASEGACRRNRIAVSYLHGQPAGGAPEFTACYDALRAVRDEIWRVHVSCRRMEQVVLATGIAPSKVHRIPLGINLSHFPLRTEVRRLAARALLGLPANAVVVGSFQKDGNGWGAGNTPKLIKGPDVLLSVLARLQLEVPDLHVLLSGAARGYVRRGLSDLGLPHEYRWIDDYTSIATLYHACDLVLVTSREEGGPKAVLESMATGVPLVSSTVGQAADLIVTGDNGWLAEVDDVDGLVRASLAALALDAGQLDAFMTSARATAARNSYDAQLEQWRTFFRC